MKRRLEIVLLFLLALVTAYALNCCFLLLNMPSDAAVVAGVLGVSALLIFVPLLVMYLIKKILKGESVEKSSTNASDSESCDTSCNH
jgi:xanthosine utilization system XapX-like protein